MMERSLKITSLTSVTTAVACDSEVALEPRTMGYRRGDPLLLKVAEPAEAATHCRGPVLWVGKMKMHVSRNAVDTRHFSRLFARACIAMQNEQIHGCSIPAWSTSPSATASIGPVVL